MKELSEAEVGDFEAEVDAAYSAYPLPHSTQASSVWHILTVSEDWPRLELHTMKPKSHDDFIFKVRRIFFLVNALKYSLRHALTRAAPNIRAGAAIPDPDPKLDRDAYGKALSLLQVGIAYDGAYRAFTTWRARRAKVYRDDLDSNLKVFKHVHAEAEYEALHGLLRSSEMSSGPFQMLAGWLAGAMPLVPAVYRIAETVTERATTLVTYPYDPKLASQLKTELAPFTFGDDIIPRTWQLPWLDVTQAKGIYEALVLGCTYHGIGVAFGGLRLQTKHWGVRSLCPMFDYDELVQEVALLADESEEITACLLDKLILGSSGIKSPDPAIQPLIVADKRRVFAPVFLVISSDFERNLLVLQNRIDEKSFDGQSCKFEAQMIERDVQPLLSARYSHYKTGTYIPGRNDAGEVDLVIADRASKTLMVSELRWMLPPGDASEVNYRKQEYATKVDQLNRKVEAARDRLSALLGHLEISVDESEQAEWKTVGVVVVSGYAGGSVGNDRGYPVVPQEIFRVGLECLPDLARLHTWLLSGSWLPRRNIDYRERPIELGIGHVRWQWSELDIFNATTYWEHVRQSCDDLRFA